MRSAGTRHGRPDEGAAAVEFALALFLLIPLTFGIIDLGTALKFKIRLNNAAREGASFAQNRPTAVTATGACTSTATTPGNVTDAVLSEQPGLSSYSGFTVTVTDQSTGTSITGCDSTTVPGGRTVRVKVDATYNLPISAFWGNKITMSSYRDVVVQ